MLYFKDLLNSCQRICQTTVLGLLLITLSLGLSAAGLPQGNAITDGKALLRYALPIDNKPVREVQASIEDIAAQLRGKRWNPINQDIQRASSVLDNHASELLASIPEDKKKQAQDLIAKASAGIRVLREAVEAKDKEQIWIERGKFLDIVGELEGLMVQKLPFEVPSEYSNLPQLKGRATVEVKTNKGSLTVVVDGYSAPVTAGNFVDLVQRGFYNGLEFIRAEESYVLQVGDPPGPEVGFIDPGTGKYRAIPLEVLAKGDPVPTYGITLEDAGRYRAQPVLPFASYGTVAMARPEFEADGGSSQFFFFLFEPELTPADRNLLDGRYAVFGYVSAATE